MYSMCMTFVHLQAVISACSSATGLEESEQSRPACVRRVTHSADASCFRLSI